MKEKLEQIKAEAIRQINESDALDRLNDVRVNFLGKKGELTAVLKSMKDVAPEERPKVGQMVNEAREEIERVMDEAKTRMERRIREAKMKAEVIDVTLPAQKNNVGHRHPNTIALEEVERIFIGMGYEVVEGPEVEKDYYNFEALNIPADHPAKDEQDTFYVNGEMLLRTQTSGVQVHEMEKGKLPIRMIAPGRVFRADEVDATHSPSFHQVEGPEVEKDYYNFEALNIPADHPAKDEQDTFYVNGEMLLRTQTSGVQVHEMEKGKLPIRMIAPGRVFRADEVDATHSPSFHQVEGLVIDKNITFADLKGTLAEFAKELFGEDTKVKFRPHHFPFTEPSAEMDVSCFKCGGKGCRFCKGEGWIEILGCGMVHPRVLRMSGIDPEEYSGFAFGVGLERIALLKYEIDDMRLLYENDIRFLKQF